MCLRNLLCKQYIQDSDMPRPNYLEDIELSEIYSIIKAEYPNTPLFIRDANYQTTTLYELRRYLKWDVTDREEYITDVFDCDDYSFRLLGNISNKYWGMLPFGAIWVERSGMSPHALNLFIDNDRKLWVTEPQDDTVSSIPSDWRPYLIII